MMNAYADITNSPSGVTVQNVVATAHLNLKKIDLNTLMQKARNVEYNPRRFVAAIMRIREPKTTCLIFHNGKLVITGAKSEESSKLASRKFARIIGKVMHAEGTKVIEHKVTNFVGSCDMRFPILLEGLLYSAHSRFLHYEPEVFPGLIYHMRQPKVALLVFASGKMVITGAKNVMDLHNAYNNICPVLQSFRKPTYQMPTTQAPTPVRNPMPSGAYQRVYQYQAVQEAPAYHEEVLHAGKDQYHEEMLQVGKDQEAMDDDWLELNSALNMVGDQSSCIL